VSALVGSTAHVSVPGHAVLVTATGHQTATADTNGGAGGVVGIAAMVPTAVVGGGVTANFDGSLTAADHLTVTATASNKADAHTFVISIGLATGSLAVADAEILSSAVTHALLGSDASVSVTNGITIDAHLIGPDQNTAVAHADGGAGGLLGSATVFKADAEDNGQTVAEVAGGVTAATALLVAPARISGAAARRR
jgi:hypothetical protein